MEQGAHVSAGQGTRQGGPTQRRECFAWSCYGSSRTYASWRPQLVCGHIDTTTRFNVLTRFLTGKGSGRTLCSRALQQLRPSRAFKTRASWLPQSILWEMNKSTSDKLGNGASQTRYRVTLTTARYTRSTPGRLLIPSKLA
jgi:hypothetical protein